MGMTTEKLLAAIGERGPEECLAYLKPPGVLSGCDRIARKELPRLRRRPRE
jgi:hypothetical protein